MRRVALMSSSSAKNVGVAAVFEDATSDRVHLGLYNRARLSTGDSFRKAHDEHQDVRRTSADGNQDRVPIAKKWFCGPTDGDSAQMAKMIENASPNGRQANLLLEARSRSPMTQHRQRPGSFSLAPAAPSKLKSKAEENKDPNTTLIQNAKADVGLERSVRRVKLAFTERAVQPDGEKSIPPKQFTPGIKIGGQAQSPDRELPPGVKVSPMISEKTMWGSSARLPVRAAFEKQAQPEETWLRLDALRVRMEMLPGGLVIERDTSITELAALISQMQQGTVETSEQVALGYTTSKHAEILAQILRISDVVDSVETKYWQWCVDMDAAPLDALAKQQVHDWLVQDGEKQAVLAQLREIGTRRCLGTSGLQHDSTASKGSCCRKFLQYGLYKANVRRCPACIKEVKRLVALSATQAVRESLAQTADSSSPPARQGEVVISEGAPTLFGVEAREIAFALYAGCPGTYLRAHVLPSDLEFAKANGSSVTVNWVDGDRRNRSVPTSHVFMLDHPAAYDVRFANSARWSKDAQRLVPNAFNWDCK